VNWLTLLGGLRPPSPRSPTACPERCQGTNAVSLLPEGVVRRVHPL